MNPLLGLDISTEKHFVRLVFNLPDFQKVLTDESNDPDINLFNDKSSHHIHHIHKIHHILV